MGNDCKIAISSTSGREGFFPKVHSVTLRDKVRSCEIRKSLNVEPLLRIERSQLQYIVLTMRPECPRKGWRGNSCWLHPLESGPEVDQGPGGVITSPALLAPILKYSEIAENREVF